MQFQKGHSKRGGRKAGTPNAVKVEVRALARSLVEDPEYQTRLQKRLRSGKLAPAVEAMLWWYAYGKPRDRHEWLSDCDEEFCFTMELGTQVVGASSAAVSSAEAQGPDKAKTVILGPRRVLSDGS